VTLRTSALVAGVLGLILLAVGLFADSQRATTTVVATASLDTPVVVLAPEVVALDGATRIAIEAQGDIEVHTARPVDAEAWLASRTVSFVTGIAEWESLSTRVAERIVSSPSPSPDPSASAGASASPGASPSPSPSPSPSVSPSVSAEPEADDAEVIDNGSADHWRSTWRGEDRVSVAVAAISPGETVVVTTVDGSPLSVIEMTLERETNDGWITPLILWGGFLTLVGLVALILTLVDVRPWQKKGEEWMRRKAQADAAGDSLPQGSRRARRASGTQIPSASLDEPVTANPLALEQSAPDSSASTEGDKS
jgi:hypothetical protein